MQSDGHITKDEMVDAGRRFQDALAQLHSDPSVESLRALQPHARRFFESLRTAYRQLGVPYGDTRDGLMRWVRDDLIDADSSIIGVKGDADQLAREFEALFGIHERMDELGSNTTD